MLMLMLSASLQAAEDLNSLLKAHKAGFQGLFCGMGMRFFPMHGESNGDYYGLYVPRDGSAPCLTMFSLEEAQLYHFSSKPKRFMANKERYLDEDFALPADERLGLKLTQELLKTKPKFSLTYFNRHLPFWLNDLDGGIYDWDLDEWAHSGKEVRTWFVAYIKENPILVKHINKAEHVLQWRPWADAGDAFAKGGDIVSALNCYDAAISMSSRFPFYGEAKKSDPSWKRLLMILDRMKLHVAESDKADKHCFSVIYPSAVKFAKDEK